MIKCHHQKDFFESCGLPVCEIKTEVLGDCPKYNELPTPSEQLNKPCEIHLAGDDYRCSKRGAFAFARYLESREGDQLLVLQPDKEDDGGVVNESINIEMNRESKNFPPPLSNSFFFKENLNVMTPFFCPSYNQKNELFQDNCVLDIICLKTSLFHFSLDSLCKPIPCPLVPPPAAAAPRHQHHPLTAHHPPYNPNILQRRRIFACYSRLRECLRISVFGGPIPKHLFLDFTDAKAARLEKNI
ncbi:hypothetical protein CDAR_270361 [Caerostris darwini]|uniref:Uncharacterized protein n=1 Tax=Caerostris darwini TaxID=1538125 RepID=A0AAV4NI62_9ARAC|nr:hypothetical protein CDAR_270361 [Caerostris darwini]